MDSLPEPKASRHLLRRLLRVLVLGFWLVMMGTLVRRWILEIRPECEPGTYRSILTPDRHDHHWRMGVYLPVEGRDTRVGYTETLYTYLPESGGYKILNTTRVEFPGPPLLGILPRRFDLHTTTWISTQYQLQQLAIQFHSKAFNVDCRGTVADGRLILVPRIDGQPQTPFEVDLPPQGTVSQGLSRFMTLPALSVGMKWTTVAINPLTMQPSVVEMEVLRREKFLWQGEELDVHVLDVRSPAIAARAWVALSGEVLQERTLFGLTLIKEPTQEEK